MKLKLAFYNRRFKLFFSTALIGISIFILPSPLIAIPNIGVNATTLPKGILFINEKWFYADYSEKYDETEGEFSKFRPNEKYTESRNLTTIAYGATDKITLAANAWFRESNINTEEYNGKDSGLGDCYFYSKIKIFSEQNEPKSGVSFLSGVRFPTGDDEEVPILRLGSGTTEVGFGFSGTTRWNNFTNSLFGCTWLKTDGGDTTMDFRATSEYDVIPKKLSLLMELKGDYIEGWDERLLVIAPGIQYIPKFPLILHASCKIPIDAKGYFKYDYQVILGISFGFPVF